MRIFPVLDGQLRFLRLYLKWTFSSNKVLQTDRQTDWQTDTTRRITTPYSRVVTTTQWAALEYLGCGGGTPIIMAVGPAVIHWLYEFNKISGPPCRAHTATTIHLLVTFRRLALIRWSGNSSSAFSSSRHSCEQVAPRSLLELRSSEQTLSDALCLVYIHSPQQYNRFFKFKSFKKI